MSSPVPRPRSPVKFPMKYKFQKLKVYQLSLQYLDIIYQVAAKLPQTEKYNLIAQFIRAATSIVLNIAEGSTGQSNAEQARFLSISIRSYLETMACFDICLRRGYFIEDNLQEAYKAGHELFVSLTAMRNRLLPEGYRVKEEGEGYMDAE